MRTAKTSIRVWCSRSPDSGCWWHPEAPGIQGGPMAQTSDVIVIGSGVVGASTALELRRAGRTVTVVDKASGPGYGSTSASSAIVRFNYSTWSGVAASWESKFRWEEWEGHLGHRDPNGAARFVRCGIIV